jgi:hypothetical protein
MQTPEQIIPHANDYKNKAWQQYTEEELGWWVRLLTKRAEHRDNEDKKAKDLYDAGNYQAMLDEMQQAGAEADSVRDYRESPTAQGEGREYGGN